MLVSDFYKIDSSHGRTIVFKKTMGKRGVDDLWFAGLGGMYAVGDSVRRFPRVKLKCGGTLKKLLDFSHHV